MSPRIHDLEAFGCTIGMGTDNMSEDMVEVMRTGMFMERVRREDGRQPTPEQALRWATVNGYRAHGDSRRRLARAGQEGRPDHDRLRAARIWCRGCAWSRPSCIRGRRATSTDVMVDGAWLMRDGKVLTMDEERDRRGGAARRRGRVGAAVRQRART